MFFVSKISLQRGDEGASSAAKGFPRSGARCRWRDNPDMDDSHQIEIPPSFMALYTPAGRPKPTLPWRALLERYELCEDMAQMLTEPTANRLLEPGITETEVLQSCLAGLLSEPAVVTAEEGHWVVTRLAELLHWPAPEKT